MKAALYAGLVASFSLTCFLNPSKDIKDYVFIGAPPEEVEYFHFGFKETLADLFWLQFIQHAFDCSKYKDPKGEHCSPRWGYKVLKAASRLSPGFEVLYVHGASQLSVLLNDSKGAAEIFEKGLQHIQKSWLIPYRAAYVYMEELKENARAAELMNLAAQKGAPFWARSLASKLYGKEGRWELTLQILSELYTEAEEGAWKRDLQKRISYAQSQLLKSGAVKTP